MSTVIKSQVSVQYPVPAGLLTVTAHPARPGTVVITVCGEVDLFTVTLLRTTLHEHTRHGGPHLILDLTEVRFLGAAGLTVLVTAWQAATTAEIGLCLVATTRPVLMPLQLTGLIGMFAVYPDLRDALPPRVSAGRLRTVLTSRLRLCTKNGPRK